MTVGREWKVILLFTLPIMGGNLLQQLYNAVDGIIVGNFIGEGALSAVGTCFPIIMLFLALAIGISIGAGIAVGQYFGAKQFDDMKITVSTSFIFMTILGIALSILGIILAKWILVVWLSVPKKILGDAVIYFRICCIGLVFSFIYNCVSSIMRSLGDSKATFYFLAIASVANIGLDLLFVPLIGVAGAALATVLAQGISVMFSLFYMHRRFPDLKLLAGFEMSKCLLILRLGMPLALQHSIISLGGMFMQRLVNGFGEISIAAFTAGMRVDNFVLAPCLAYQAGLSAFISQNIGASRDDRVKSGLNQTIIMSVITSIIISITLFITAEFIASLFGLTEASMARAAEQIRFVAAIFIIFAIFSSYIGFLQGAGDVLILSVVSAVSLFVRVALAYLGVDVGILSYEAAWVTMPVSWMVTLIALFIRYKTGGWKKKAIAGGFGK